MEKKIQNDIDTVERKLREEALDRKLQIESEMKEKINVRQ